MKAALSVTQSLHLDFFETHLQDSLLDLVSDAYHAGIPLPRIEEAVHLLHDSYHTPEETVMRAFTLRCMQQALKESNADALHVAAQILLTTFEAHGASQVDAAAAAQLKLLQEHATSPVQPVLVELLLFLCGSNQYSGDFTFSLLLLLLQHFLPIAWTARNRDDLVQELVQHIHSSSMDQLGSLPDGCRGGAGVVCFRRHVPLSLPLGLRRDDSAVVLRERRPTESRVAFAAVRPAGAGGGGGWREE